MPHTPAHHFAPAVLPSAAKILSLFVAPVTMPAELQLANGGGCMHDATPPRALVEAVTRPAKRGATITTRAPFVGSIDRPTVAQLYIVQAGNATTQLTLGIATKQLTLDTALTYFLLAAPLHEMAHTGAAFRFSQDDILTAETVRAFVAAQAKGAHSTTFNAALRHVRTALAFDTSLPLSVLASIRTMYVNTSDSISDMLHTYALNIEQHHIAMLADKITQGKLATAADIAAAMKRLDNDSQRAVQLAIGQITNNRARKQQKAAEVAAAAQAQAARATGVKMAVVTITAQELEGLFDEPKSNQGGPV